MSLEEKIKKLIEETQDENWKIAKSLERNELPGHPEQNMSREYRTMIQYRYNNNIEFINKLNTLLV